MWMKTTMTVILILLEIVLAELTNNVRERAADCYFFLLYAKEKKKGSLQVAWLNSTKKKNKKNWLMVVQGNGSDYYLLHFCGFKVIFV